MLGGNLTHHCQNVETGMTIGWTDKRYGKGIENRRTGMKKMFECKGKDKKWNDSRTGK
jgi:hypothetical protein